MTDRLEVAIRLTYVALYAGVCVAFLLLAFPGVRTGIAQAGRRQLYAYRVGVYRGKRTSLPVAWQALRRTDLPDEPAAA